MTTRRGGSATHEAHSKPPHSTLTAGRDLASGGSVGEVRRRTSAPGVRAGRPGLDVGPDLADCDEHSLPAADEVDDLLVGGALVDDDTVATRGTEPQRQWESCRFRTYPLTHLTAQLGTHVALGLPPARPAAPGTVTHGRRIRGPRRVTARGTTLTASKASRLTALVKVISDWWRAGSPANALTHQVYLARPGAGVISLRVDVHLVSARGQIDGANLLGPLALVRPHPLEQSDVDLAG